MTNPQDDRPGGDVPPRSLDTDDTQHAGTHDPGAMRELEQQARIGRTRMSEALSPEDRQLIINRAQQFRKEEKLSLADLATMVNYRESVVSQVLAGTYKANPDAVLAAIESVIEVHRARSAQFGQRPFVQTGVAMEIFAIAHAADDRAGIGVVFGPARIGKSMTLQALLRKYRTGVLVEVNDGCCAPTHLYQELAERGLRQFRLDWARKAELFRLLRDKLRGSRRMLIFDEAENLQMASLNAIRQLHDATGCPVLLVGRPPLWAKLKATRSDARMGGAMLGRIIAHRDLLARTRSTADGDGAPLFTVAEIVQMVQRREVRIAADAAKWLCGVANLVVLDDGREGCGLSYAINLFELAVKLNRRSSTVTLDMLKAVNATLLDEDYVERIHVEIETYCGRHKELRLA